MVKNIEKIRKPHFSHLENRSEFFNELNRIFMKTIVEI